MRRRFARARVEGTSTQLGGDGDRGNLPSVAGKGGATSAARRQDKARRRAADLAPINAGLQASSAASLGQLQPV
jgi:hypothetical protein